ncbi:hypothetical protein Q8G38_20630 [Halomonas venusta]|uniref:hypothetical protein n=1 Tax=Vreelandella venusta TaxID=44935 RepID=UPI00295E418B|nr:hypothetical protein [Halomonas venusta]MDW0361722.1 hypothetical protein [Halomonas venusta]
MINSHTSLSQKPGRYNNELFWIGKITIALLQITPVHVFTCTALYILSQVSMLAAILLPWKLLMIMATENYPWVIPEALRVLSERELVLALGITAFFAFFVYASCEILIGFVCRRGSAFILNKNQKMGLFNGHREHAALLYRRFLRAVAAVFTVSVIAACLLYLYPYMLLTLITYLLIGLTMVVWQRSNAPQTTLAILTPEMKATIWWGAGFFYAVSWLIADYWRGMLPGLATAFIALLLVRQAIVLIFPVYGTYALFIKQRNKVDALFLADIPWSPDSRTDDGFMALIEPVRREVWINSLLHQSYGVAEDISVINCKTSNAGKSASLITSTSIKGQSERAFLVKLFHSSSEDRALHEKAILEVLPTNWLAPHFCGVHNVEGHLCHVFEWPSQACWMSASKRSEQLPGIREKLLALELPDELVSRYERSRPHLSDRLELITWDVLASLSPKSSFEDCQQLQRYWPDICHAARSQPRQIVIPRIHQHLIGDAGNKSLICNWTRWLWEPVGAGWPLSTNEDEFQQAINKATTQRPYLAQVNVKNTGLMALLYEFERLWRIKKHTEAVKLITPLYEATKNSKLL